jgi:hypothetical protein
MHFLRRYSITTEFRRTESRSALDFWIAGAIDPRPENNLRFDAMKIADR